MVKFVKNHVAADGETLLDLSEFTKIPKDGMSWLSPQARSPLRIRTARGDASRIGTVSRFSVGSLVHR